MEQLESGNKKTSKKKADSETEHEDMETEEATNSRKRKHEQAFELSQFSSSEDSSDDEKDKEGVGSDDDSDDMNIDEMEDVSQEEDGQEDSAVRWKSNLAQKAADAFLERQATTQNLWKLVYGECHFYFMMFRLHCMKKEDIKVQIKLINLWLTALKGTMLVK